MKADASAREEYDVKPKKTAWKMEIKIAIVCGAAMLLGILLGAVFANTMSGETVNSMGAYLGEFIKIVKQEEVKGTGLSSVMVKYGKYLAIIWLCGFLAPGSVIVLLTLLFRGISCGFTTSILVHEYGGKGVLFAVLSYLPQNLFLIPAYTITAFFALQLILRRFQKLPAKARLKRENTRITIEYVIILLCGILFISVASIIEVYGVPVFLKLYN